MNWTHYLSLALSSFAGGAATYAGSHLAGLSLTNTQQLGAFALGCGIAGVVAVCNLLQKSPLA